MLAVSMWSLYNQLKCSLVKREVRVKDALSWGQNELGIELHFASVERGPLVSKMINPFFLCCIVR